MAVETERLRREKAEQVRRYAELASQQTRSAANRAPVPAPAPGSVPPPTVQPAPTPPAAATGASRRKVRIGEGRGNESIHPSRS